MDPSSKKIMDDLYKGEIKAINAGDFYFGGILINDSKMSSGDMAAYSWNRWGIPTYHKRLKPSY